VVILLSEPYQIRDGNEIGVGVSVSVGKMNITKYQYDLRVYHNTVTEYHTIPLKVRYIFVYPNGMGIGWDRRITLIVPLKQLSVAEEDYIKTYFNSTETFKNAITTTTITYDFRRWLFF